MAPQLLCLVSDVNTEMFTKAADTLVLIFFSVVFHVAVLMLRVGKRSFSG
jgi:hypothetical protein